MDSPVQKVDWIWFEDDAMHVDAERYAKLRGITVEDAETELTEMCAEWLPSAPITHALRKKGGP